MKKKKRKKGCSPGAKQKGRERGNGKDRTKNAAGKAGLHRPGKSQKASPPGSGGRRVDTG